MKKSEFKALLDEVLQPFNERITSLEQSYSAVKGKQKSVITLASRSVPADHYGSNDPIKRKVNY